MRTFYSPDPNKKGKGQISDAKKKVLYSIGFEELSRAIYRYKAGLEKDEWRKPQNGSTFFNSGYVDYLDANYSDNSSSYRSITQMQEDKKYAEQYERVIKALENKREPEDSDLPFA